VREQAIGIDGPVPLSGTLALPEGDGPFPAVLIASGSGPLDRNSKPPPRSLRRRTPARAGARDWRAAGFSDNADDLGAALHALAARSEIDPDRLLLAGHSEGALLAATLTARGSAVSGVVLLSMSATPGADLLLWQTRQIVPTLPGPVRRLLRLLRVDVEKKVAANHAKVRSTTTDVARIGGAKVNARWLREFMAHDPRGDLARIDVPVLAITGEKDLQVPVDDLDVIASTVRGPVQVHRVPDLTHTLRTQPGAPSLRRYRRELREPVNREVLGAVTQWCSEVAAAAAAST
jgi:uncharacterized protein